MAFFEVKNMSKGIEELFNGGFKDIEVEFSKRSKELQINY